jgi:uncharacterized protein (DUF924 family)
MKIVDAAEVLTFWFAPGRAEQWYAEDANFDADIRRRFLATYEAACSGQLDHWRDTPHDLLALIIVLDQFPRNMFRSAARAFATDAQAVTLTKQGIDKGFDRSFTGAELDFFTMPLMHSESLTDQALLLAMGYGDNRYAREHYETIARFGRLPHRNAILGRKNTAEEDAYLSARQIG